jgi:hypothetical protein
MIRTDRRNLVVGKGDRAGAASCGSDRRLQPLDALGPSRTAVDVHPDPWKEAVVPSTPRRFGFGERARILEVADNNG